MYWLEKFTLDRKNPLAPVEWAVCQCDRASELFRRARDVEGNLQPKSVVKYPGGPDDGWSDVGSLTEAVELGLYGWREGEKLMKAQIAQAHIMQKLFVRKAAGVDVGGMYPLIPAAVAGDPMCMVTPSSDSLKAKPIVRIVVNVAVSGNVPREVIYARGGAILAWVDELERCGYRCEIVVVETGIFGANGANPKGIMFMATGKLPEEPLDIDRMGFLLCHPAVQRRVFFGLYEGDDAFERELGLTKAQLMTYGQPTDDISSDWIGQHSVYFPAMRRATGDWVSPEMAAAAVERIIAKNLQVDEADADSALDLEDKKTDAAPEVAPEPAPEPYEPDYYDDPYEEDYY